MATNNKALINLTAIIGYYEELRTKSVDEMLRGTFYHIIIEHKDQLVKNYGADEKMDTYETIPMLLDKGKKKTYRTTKVDEFGDTVECDATYSKFTTLPPELGECLTFLLNRFIHEANSCFVQNGQVFEPVDRVLDQIANHSAEKYKAESLAAPIIRFCSVFNVDRVVDGVYLGCAERIVKMIGTHFCHENRSPGNHLTAIVNVFLRYMRMMAVFAADILFEKRQTIHLPLICSIMHSLNQVAIGLGCPPISREIMSHMKKFSEMCASNRAFESSAHPKTRIAATPAKKTAVPKKKKTPAKKASPPVPAVVDDLADDGFGGEEKQLGDALDDIARDPISAWSTEDGDW